ncbi:MAG: serine/threonine protein kinase [Cyanobacteria bacterium REEB67]|nr:serine/threonine protein kinase [Cyanobacteria bacterium REEB67]
MSDLRRTLAQSSTFIVVEGALQSGSGSLYLSSTDGAPAAVDTLPLGTVIDSKYRLISVLGQGGMGTVFRAHHLALAKDVALKTFHTSELDREMRDRFLREARSIAKLENKQIVRVFDFGIAEGDRPYYTMELLHGQSLAERLVGRQALSVDEAVSIFYAVAEGLISAHSLGIVHRDLKPGNIFLQLDGDKICGVKIVDFGIAKFSGGSDLVEQSQTATGMIFGSPLYMSPEQSLGLPVDRRSDIYSFGCAFYEALTGFPPFQGKSAIATIMAHQQQPVPPLNLFCPEKTFPLWLSTLVAKMLAKSRDDRISSFQEVIDVISYNCQIQSPSGPVDLPGAGDGTTSEDYEGTPANRLFGGNTSGKRVAVVFVCLTLFVLAAFSLAGVSVFRPSKSTVLPASVEASKVGEQIPLAVSAADRAGVAAPDMKVGRFFQGVEKGPNGRVAVYDFGSKSLGYFGNLGDRHLFECVGKVELPVKSVWLFSPGELMMRHLELFQGFADHDLEMISFDCNASANSSWESKHIEAISHLTSLRGLFFPKSLIDSKAVPYLNKMRGLEILEVGESNLTGKDLSRLIDLKNLRDLVAARTVDMAAFIKKAPEDHKELNNLLLKGSPLDDSIMPDLGRIKTLRSLNLEETDVSNRGLVYLTSLPRLQELYLGGTELGPGLAAILVKIKTLKHLTLPSGSLSQGDAAIFSKALPACIVRADGKKIRHDKKSPEDLN